MNKILCSAIELENNTLNVAHSQGITETLEQTGGGMI